MEGLGVWDFYEWKIVDLSEWKVYIFQFLLMKGVDFCIFYEWRV